MKRVGEKRGQVTIFIIIAIVIVGVVIGFFFISPRGSDVESSGTFEVGNPRGFIQSCLEEDFIETVEEVSLQGGSVNPEHYILYDDSPVEYLCYTSEDYNTCVVQRSLLKNHIESEIKTEMMGKISDCFSSLVTNYESKNYDVELISGASKVELFPDRLVLSMGHAISVTKSNTERTEGFSITLNNNLYELVNIANSIVDWESTYGDSETSLYTNSYSNIKVEKKQGQDSSKIYILTDVNTKDKFQFASRSIPLPSGFGEVNI